LPFPSAIEHERIAGHVFADCVESLEEAEWAGIWKIGEYLHCFRSMDLAKANALGNPNHSIEDCRNASFT
jgi:hypothetical protein